MNMKLGKIYLKVSVPIARRKKLRYVRLRFCFFYFAIDSVSNSMFMMEIIMLEMVVFNSMILR